VGNQNLEVSYTARTSQQWDGKQVPVLLNIHILELVSNPGGAVGYKFVYQIPPKVNVTAALNNPEGKSDIAEAVVKR
jgi:hypothetical protein